MYKAHQTPLIEGITLIFYCYHERCLSFYSLSQGQFSMCYCIILP